MSRLPDPEDVLFFNNMFKDKQGQDRLYNGYSTDLSNFILINLEISLQINNSFHFREKTTILGFLWT